MIPLQQLATALRAPAAAFGRAAQPVAALAVYFLCGLALFGLAAHLLVDHQDLLRHAVMAYLLPQSWHGIADRLIDFFFASQTRVVLSALILNTALVVGSVVLFPLKEYCSARFEAQFVPALERPAEFPLWRQGLEELKLLALYLVFQGVILGLGYYPYPATQLASSALSVLFLCFSFGLDFISPTLQRHRHTYASVLKLLLRNGLLTLLFGAVFALPLLLIGNQILARDTLTLAETAGTLMLVNLLMLTMAIPAGTWVACQLRGEAAALRPPGMRARRLTVGAIALVLALALGFHSLVGLSLHRKSQILKCEYSIDWGPVRLDLPSWSQLRRGEQAATLQFDLRIHNPTPFDLAFEESLLSLWQNQKLVSTTEINSVTVPSGSTAVQPMTLVTQMDMDALSSWRHLAEGWTVQIQFDLLPGLPFVLQMK